MGQGRLRQVPPLEILRKYRQPEAILQRLESGAYGTQVLDKPVWLLARRQRVELDLPLGWIYVHSPEDLILYKLQYFNLSAQTKHARDILGMLLARGPTLNYTYLNTWCSRLGLQPAWHRLLEQARQLGAQIPG